MGSNLNFKNFGNEPPGNGGGDGGNRPPGNFPLARQTSIYSLTFDEFQSSLGKDFGSMNMDELLKNIWTAEETTMASTSGGGGYGGAGAGSSAATAGGAGLQRQGSLTLPRTLSQKTVDEVWRDFSVAGKDSVGGGSSNLPQRQQTLGEMTLEEFLVRAGVVREETQVAGKGNNGGFFGNNISNAGLGIGFQQDSSRVSNLIGDRSQDASDPPLNMMNGVRLNQQQQPILPKQPNLGYGTQGGNPQLGSPGIRSGIVGLGNINNTGLAQNAAFQNVGYGLAGGGFQVGVVVGAGLSPVTPLSSDGIGKSNGEVSSVSPVPYSFGGGIRGRRSSGAVEKVAERRQRRMIKNRESAARSRARKQAYTTELEAEVAKLKEENEELKRKQAEMMELQKNQATEIMNLQGGPKKRLRRTQSGPW